MYNQNEVACCEVSVHHALRAHYFGLNARFRFGGASGPQSHSARHRLHETVILLFPLLQS